MTTNADTAQLELANTPFANVLRLGGLEIKTADQFTTLSDTEQQDYLAAMRRIVQADKAKRPGIYSDQRVPAELAVLAINTLIDEEKRISPERYAGLITIYQGTDGLKRILNSLPLDGP